MSIVRHFGIERRTLHTTIEYRSFFDTHSSKMNKTADIRRGPPACSPAPGGCLVVMCPNEPIELPFAGKIRVSGPGSASVRVHHSHYISV